jgi:hypothetical protein
MRGEGGGTGSSPIGKNVSQRGDWPFYLLVEQYD